MVMWRNFEGPFLPAKKNLFVRLEGELMRTAGSSACYSANGFRRHITYHLDPILRRLRGGHFPGILMTSDTASSSGEPEIILPLELRRPTHG